MQPHQIASEKIRQGGEYPYHVLKNLGLTAAGGAVAKLGSAAASSLIPHINALISEYVPEKFSEKALSKLDPRMGEFVNQAKEKGFEYDEIKKFIGDKINKPQEGQTEKNIIQKHSPELHQFILDQIQQGRSPIEAGAIASLDKKGGKGFKSIIDKIVKENKTSWASILQTIYGQGQQAQQPQQEQAQQPQQGGIDPQLAQILQQGSQLLQKFRGQ